MKKWFKIFLVVSLCLCAVVPFAAAQQYPYKAKVVLMNGDVINGFLKEPWFEGNVKLKLSDKTLLEIDSSDIRTLRQSKINGSKSQLTFHQKGQRGEFGKQLGFYHHTFAGLSFGENDKNGSLGLINGYRFSDLFALGLGVSYDRFRQAAALPIYVQPRVYIRNEKVSLYYFTDLGYSPAWQNRGVSNQYQVINTKGGLMGQVGMGYQVNFSKSALNFTLGYKLQQLDIHAEYYSPEFTTSENPTFKKVMDVKEKRLVRRVVLTAGFTL